MAVISLLTDFGTEDEYVGLVKAVIYGIAPSACIVDLCHRVPPQDVMGAAYLIDSAWPHFPPGSVHLVVVDPGVGTDRAVVAVEAAGHRFVAPDNGVLFRIVENDPAARIVRVENRTLFRPDVSRTFHGRDIFAPVGAHLLLGLGLDRLGPAMGAGALCRLQAGAPQADGGEGIRGTVVWVDRFGNLVTNIEAEAFSGGGRIGGPGQLTVHVGDVILSGLSACYGDAAPGQALALVGSRGTLEIAVNRGSAADLLGCGAGEPVVIRR